MTLAAYNGHEALTFGDYLDLGTGRTLHAEPGGTYDVAPAGGRVVPDIPEPWFTAVSGESAETAEATEGDGAPGADSRDEAADEPDDEDEPSAF